MVYGAWHVLLLIKCFLQHVKFATKTDQVRTVFVLNFFECLQPEISSFLLFREDISGVQLVKYFSHKHSDLSQVADTQRNFY